MRLLTSQETIVSTFNKLLDKCDSVSFAVAWASYGFESCNRLLKLRRKIRQGVVGTHFYQTDPKFIEKFKGSRNVKFITDKSGVFHPKIYLFDGPKDEWHCLVGSANFTAGGFSKNTEVLAHIEKRDDRSGKIAAELRSLIDGYTKLQVAKFADEIDLAQYRYWKDRFQRTIDKSQGHFGGKTARKSLEEIEILNAPWQEFLSKVKGGPYHQLTGRIKILREARRLFEKYGSLAAMPIEVRQAIGGIVESKEMQWGWFGSMRGAGVFKNIINKKHDQLSKALDCIPPTGPVQRADYREYIDLYLTCFPRKSGAPTRHGLATATRLLAMKRPDYFVCFDKANKTGLSKAFGITMHHHDYDAYWDSVIERICVSKWWNSRRPKAGEDGQVWDGRAAFLDAIYYVPVDDAV